MIFTESTIKISNNSAKMDSTIVLYRGDKNVEIRFTILQSPFKYSNTVATNIIESTNASYGQLVIKTPNDKPPIFSEVSATKEGTILFTITKEMIDEIEEVGAYTFQIRLLDDNKQSRVTIPPVENGIEIKEPIAIEDDNTTNVVGLAKANYAVATLSDVDTPTFDDNGKYNKTNWNDGDIITNASLNKIEDGIYTTNENVTATKKYVDDDINYNNKQFNNKISAIHMSRHPVSCSTEIYKKPLCDIFPELLNITYNTVFKEFNSFKVNMDNFAKEYPTVKSAYNKLNINLYDENDNSIGNSYGNSINGEGLNIIFINITESLRFYAYFDKALVDGSDTTMETKNGYMTIQLLIPKGNNKQEFIDKIKNLKLTLSVFRVDFLNLNNETIYTPTTDYNPATKKYVDDEIYSKGLKEYIGTKENPVLFTEIKSGWSIVKNYYKWYAEYENPIPCGDMLVHKFPFGKNFYITYMNGAELTRYGYNTTTHVTKGYSHVLNNEVLTTYNTQEYTPTTDYHPATKKYVDDNRDYYFKVPTILYDDTNLPKGYVDITTLEQGTNYRVNSSIVSGFFKVSLKAPNDDGTWFTVDDGSNTIGWSSMLSTSICVQLKSDTFIAINMNCINNYCKYLSITKENGKWKLMQTKLNSISPDNTYKYDVTNDYNPAHKKYVDDKISSLPQISFNENGELVVTINGVSKTFVPKNV